MNFSELPFDTEQLIIDLRPWVEAESPGYDAVAVNKVVDLAHYELASLGAYILRVPGRFGRADILKAMVGNQTDKPGIVLCCFADTVHSTGSINTVPYRREGNKLWGAGITAKAGLFLCIETIKQLLRHAVPTNLPVTMLVVPDKQLGCPTSRGFIEACVKRQAYALVPDVSNGSVYSGGAAQLRYKIDTKLDQSADINSSSGHRSAVAEMAHQVLHIEEMSTDDCSFRVGAIESGRWVSYSEICTAEVISIAGTEAAVNKSKRDMLALNSPNPDLGLHVNCRETLPLWLPSMADRALLEQAQQLADSLGNKLTVDTGPGGSLAGIAASQGVATLDGLGPVGAGTRAEYIHIDSMSQRAKLLAGLLSNLS